MCKFPAGGQLHVAHYQAHAVVCFTWLSSHDNFNRAVLVSHKWPIDHGLEALLSMNGEVFVLELGFWVKMEAWRVATDQHRPHGIRYCFTLHDKNQQRLLGYDNAHAVRGQKRVSSARKTEWDHRHEAEAVHGYTFVSAEQLLVDFWSDVERLLQVSECPTK
jgi:hypothetical protein